MPRTLCILVRDSTTELRKLKTNKAEKLSLYRQWENFPFPFPPFPRREFENFSCVVYTHTKLHVQAKKSPFWIFNGYMMVHFVSLSLLSSLGCTDLKRESGNRPVRIFFGGSVDSWYDLLMGVNDFLDIITK